MKDPHYAAPESIATVDEPGVSGRLRAEVAALRQLGSDVVVIRPGASPLDAMGDKVLDPARRWLKVTQSSGAPDEPFPFYSMQHVATRDARMTNEDVSRGQYRRHSPEPSLLKGRQFKRRQT